MTDPDREHSDSESSSPALPRIYTLAEAAEHLRAPEGWLRAQLANRRFAGLKRGNRWCMTEAQILAAIVAMSTTSRAAQVEAERAVKPYGGLTRRSWLHHQRSEIPGTTQYSRRHGSPQKGPPAPRVEVEPAPSWYKMVYRESDEMIAKLPALSGSQQELLARVHQEGEVIVDGKSRRTVEALVRRGLASYEVSHVLNRNKDGTVYRFTVRPIRG